MGGGSEVWAGVGDYRGRGWGGNGNSQFFVIGSFEYMLLLFGIQEAERVTFRRQPFGNFPTAIRWSGLPSPQ